MCKKFKKKICLFLADVCVSLFDKSPENMYSDTDSTVQTKQPKIGEFCFVASNQQLSSISLGAHKLHARFTNLAGKFDL